MSKKAHFTNYVVLEIGGSEYPKTCRARQTRQEPMNGL